MKWLSVPPTHHTETYLLNKAQQILFSTSVLLCYLNSMAVSQDALYIGKQKIGKELSYHSQQHHTVFQCSYCVAHRRKEKVSEYITGADSVLNLNKPFFLKPLPSYNVLRVWLVLWQYLYSPTPEGATV